MDMLSVIAALGAIFGITFFVAPRFIFEELDLRHPQDSRPPDRMDS